MEKKMNLVIQGTKNFSEYSIFMRAMHTAMTIVQIKQATKVTIFSAGPLNINDMVREFFGVTERSLKSKGISIKIVRIPPKWINENISEIDYFVYLSKPKESLSPQAELAEAKNVEIGVYRY